MQCDTNGDGVPDSREFAGSHRYNTAVALAERFAADEGSVSTVIIASGESQVDAVTAAGLAGNLNAPVMLTRSNQLPHNVARFIDEQNVTDVVVVGGTAAVPDSIVTALESLGSKPTVERISGADRYATAAAIGDRLGGPNPTWCGSDQSAAILVNGGEDGRADAVISGPLAFRLGLPILLTGADELPESTSSFLTDNKVERVVVVGGMGAVSAGIVNELVEEVGVVNVQRISGGSAAATSVMVAKEMLGNCADVLSTNKDMVALVNRDAIADGIAAAPVLGRGLGDGGSVPILLVGDELPAAVSDYLASTAEVRGGMKTHQRILAIGGTAVVSASVMADAVAAAKTSSMLTATITPHKYAAHEAAAAAAAGKAVGDYKKTFEVTFSDDVTEPTQGTSGTTTAAEAQGTAVDPTMYRINGRRLEASTTTANPVDEPVTVNDLIFTANRTVMIKLSHHLEAGDTITVDNSANEAKGTKLGKNSDLRNLEPASLTLAAVTITRDRNAPVVEVVANPGNTMFDILVTEPYILHSEVDANPDGTFAEGSNLDDFVKVQAHRRTANRAVTVTSATDASSVGRQANTIHERYRVTVSPALEHGDVIVIERKAILDTGGRGSPLVRYTVPRDRTNTAPPTGKGNLEITSVSIGNYVPSAQAKADIASDMDVHAKATGVASGARGNDWIIFGYDDRGSTTGKAFTIDVDVDIANQRISYTIDNALPLRVHSDPTIGDLAAALVSNDDFNANFELKYQDDTRPGKGKGTPLSATFATGVKFTEGSSQVGVVVKFNALIATDKVAGTNFADLAGDIATGVDATAVLQMAATFLAPDNQVHISYESANIRLLPKRSGFRVIAADRVYGYDGTNTPRSGPGNGNVREILNSLRPDASIKP